MFCTEHFIDPIEKSWPTNRSESEMETVNGKFFYESVQHEKLHCRPIYTALECIAMELTKH